MLTQELSMSEADHRVVGQRLDLFHFQEEAPGMAFWHPRGFRLLRLLEEAVRQQLQEQGYEEVRTPQLIRRPIWEQSGHWEHYAEGMFRWEEGSMESALKPVSCPGHIQILKRGVLSWRDLPLRMAEFGVVHRSEPSGTLHGLLRLRQFTQDDGHIFCSMEQAQAEALRFCRSVLPYYARFGFHDVSLALSTRPESRFGDEELWDQAEAALRLAAEASGLSFTVQEGDGAFYGPKLEFVLKDNRGRAWQCGTLQYDLFLPRRFDLRYTDRSGERPWVVMLHRALHGSLERFLGVLLEQYGGNLPGWLAPEQVRLLPVVESHREAAEQLASELRKQGLRVQIGVDDRALRQRIGEAHHEGVPWVVVLGDREVRENTLSLRFQGEQSSLPRAEAVERLKEALKAPV